MGPAPAPERPGASAGGGPPTLRVYNVYAGLPCKQARSKIREKWEIAPPAGIGTASAERGAHQNPVCRAGSTDQARDEARQREQEGGAVEEGGGRGAYGRLTLGCSGGEAMERLDRASAAQEPLRAVGPVEAAASGRPAAERTAADGLTIPDQTWTLVELRAGSNHAACPHVVSVSCILAPTRGDQSSVFFPALTRMWGSAFLRLPRSPTSRRRCFRCGRPATGSDAGGQDRRATAPAHIAAGPRMAMSPRLGLCRRR